MLHFRSYGSTGGLCVILHGLLGSGENWQSPSNKLASSGYKVYTLDLRNPGQSFHSDKMDYPVMAQDVHLFIRRLNVGPVNVIGHSMGGKVGMELALSNPDDISRLVVVDISPFRYKPMYANVFRALEGIDIKKLKNRGQADRQLEKTVSDRMVRLFLLKNLGRTRDGQFYWKINLKALANNYHHIWDGIDTARAFNKPVLFMEGEKSEAGIKLQFEEIKKAFPRAAYTMIKGAGHWVHSEKPREFLHSVTSFLGE